MTVLVTGAAGFIGYHVSKQLLTLGEEVVGVDNVNDYYDVNLKYARLEQLKTFGTQFTFHKVDIADKKAMEAVVKKHKNITKIVHLAAQAGVRYSIENPFAYLHSNLAGHLVMLEVSRHLLGLEHFVYASSSSVYGANSMLPFSVRDEVCNPISLYGATKISNELMTYSYSHLYQIPATGLRLFTVYGPWGRPDMAIYLFAKAIYEGKPIKLFSNGELQRDFTYIDDIVEGIMAALGKPPLHRYNVAPHRIYNLGNHRNESVRHLVHLLETAIGKEAQVINEPMQAGDMKETLADIKESTKDLGFYPKVRLEAGVPQFVEWFLQYYPASLAQQEQKALSA